MNPADSADLVRVQRFDLSRLLDWFDGQPEPIPDDVVHAATNLRVWLQDHLVGQTETLGNTLRCGNCGKTMVEHSSLANCWEC